MGEMSDDYEVSIETAISRRAKLNPEQHRFQERGTGSHTCLCGKTKLTGVHMRYERAAAPYRAMNYNVQAQAARPTTGNYGKDVRWRKWQHELAMSKLGSDRESVALAMLDTFSKDSESCKTWLKAEKLRRLDALKLKQAKDRQENLEVAKRAESIGEGKLYFAPLGTQPDFGPEWVELGHTSEGLSESIEVAGYDKPVNFADAFKSRTDHVHFDFTATSDFMTNLKKAFNGGSVVTASDSGKSIEVSTVIKEANAMSNINQNPDDMEKAALRLATLAQEIREHDEREPQGDEPVMTWKKTFDDEHPEYTYVAVKLGGRWHVTGNQHSGRSYVWRDFLGQNWASPVAAGDFLICTEWTPAA